MALLSRGVLAKTIEIVWHADSQDSDDDEAVYNTSSRMKIEPKLKPEPRPIQAVACHPTQDILVTIGDDRTMKVWELNRSHAVSFLEDMSGRRNMEKVVTCLASESLKNVMPLCVSWSPMGNIVAVGSADGTVGLYWRSKNRIGTTSEDGGRKKIVYPEKWTRQRLFRGPNVSEVLSVAFSPDSKYIMSGSITGELFIHSVTSHTAHCAYIAPEYHENTKAVAWDPWNRLVASFGCHPALKVASFYLHKCKPCLAKARTSKAPHIEYDTTATLNMSYSPDGMLLAVPYGKCSGDCNRCAYIYSRDNPEKPVIRLGMVEAVANPVLGCAWSPMFFEPLTTDAASGSLSVEERLPWGPYQEYRMAIALWTEGAVIVYTTDCSGRHSFFTDLHIQPITGLSWSHDSRYIFVSSADCYVSMLYFADEIGVAHRTFDFVLKPTVCSFLDVALSQIRASATVIEETMTKIRENCDNETEVHLIQPKKKKKRTEKEDSKNETVTAANIAIEVSYDDVAAVMDATETTDTVS